MSDRLMFADPESAADALTFAGRAARLPVNEVRLQARAGVLAMTAAALSPQGLGDATPTVLGLRALAVDPELECDIVVTASALTAATDDDRAVLLPATGLAPAWTGVAPPRAGWAESGTLPAAVVAEKARGGMSRVARAVPTDAGEDVVRTVRSAIWGEPDEDLAGLPAGVSFAAVTLGFVHGAESARVFTSGRWTRISFRRGHVLSRGPVATGMTAVRATGSRA